MFYPLSHTVYSETRSKLLYCIVAVWWGPVVYSLCSRPKLSGCKLLSTSRAPTPSRPDASCFPHQQGPQPSLRGPTSGNFEIKGNFENQLGALLVWKATCIRSGGSWGPTGGKQLASGREGVTDQGPLVVESFAFAFSCSGGREHKLSTGGKRLASGSESLAPVQ